MNHDRFVPRGVPALAALVLSLAPTSGRAAGVKAMFDLSAPETAPFPTDLFTRRDDQQMTGVRVNLPKPAGCDLPKPPGGKPYISSSSGVQVFTPV